MDGAYKIVLTGPESSGKSTLAKQLAEHFGGIYINEYARYYLETNGPQYNYALLKKMAAAHLIHQQQFLKSSSSLFFLDTDLINYHIWFKVVFGKVPDIISENINKEDEHKYLLLYPDLNWQQDPLRENPDNREELFYIHLHMIKKLNRDFEVIKGYENQRVENAKKAVEKLLGQF